VKCLSSSVFKETNYNDDVNHFGGPNAVEIWAIMRCWICKYYVFEKECEKLDDFGDGESEK